MEENKKLKIRNAISIGSIILVAVMAGVLYLVTRKPESNESVLIAVVLVFLVFYWILVDIIEPRLLHEFDQITPARKQLYYKYIGLDALGYLGLAFFLINIRNLNRGAIGAAVYIVMLSLVRKAKKDFYTADKLGK